MQGTAARTLVVGCIWISHSELKVSGSHFWVSLPALCTRAEGIRRLQHSAKSLQPENIGGCLRPDDGY